MKFRTRFIAVILFTFSISIGLESCDKVSQARVIKTDLDTNLYPGNFVYYEFPTFEDNTNTFQNVLIEDFTGHFCSGCPNATTIAKSLEESNSGRVYSVAIHAGYQGVSSLQEVTSDYPYDFTTPEGIEMAITYSNGELGFLSNPTGAINRVIGPSGNMFTGPGTWADLVETQLAAELEVNLQAKSNYYPSTNGVFLHVESEFLADAEGNYNIVVYAVRNEIIAPQKNGVERIPDYKHHNVHVGNIFGEVWGRSVSSGFVQQGTKITTDFSYQLPNGVSNDDMHFLVLVFNRETYEVKQVIKHMF